MPISAVVMFCGPHDEGDKTPTRRIDHAINLAIRDDLPLFVAGDAFGGEEVDYFQMRASHAGVTVVIPAFDPRRCTISDAQVVARQILEQRLERLAHIHLVTDWWHMDRALTMLECELARILGRRIHVQPASVLTGPTPSSLVYENERHGLADYLAGRYGQRRVIDPLRHRPERSP